MADEAVANATGAQLVEAPLTQVNDDLNSVKKTLLTFDLDHPFRPAVPQHEPDPQLLAELRRLPPLPEAQGELIKG